MSRFEYCSKIADSGRVQVGLVGCALFIVDCMPQGDHGHLSGESSTSSDTSVADDPSSEAQTGAGSQSHSDASSSAASEDTSTTSGDPDSEMSLDEKIAALLAAQEIPVEPLQDPDAPSPALYDLGEALFFDPILSGNKDIACATCHHPSLASSDGIELSLGTGASGLGGPRQEGPHRGYIKRHAPTLFNVGDKGVSNLFWDGRIELSPDDGLITPAGGQLPNDLTGILAAQALFPLIDRLEMRGEPGDRTVLGEHNELADIEDHAMPEIWGAIMVRILHIERYVELFSQAFPDVAADQWTIAHAANAIAAYEREAFAFPNTRWDDYLKGDLDALSEQEKLGAFHFYNPDPISGACARCHSGALFTDQKFHDTGVPQLGPGHPDSAPYDLGRAHATGHKQDRFRFRTPSLRNVVLSPPYMHNGSYQVFSDAVMHYFRPTLAIENYDASVLHTDLIDTVRQGPDHMQERSATLSDLLARDAYWGAVSDIGWFLHALTDPAANDLPMLRPSSVPSGLQVP